MAPKKADPAKQQAAPRRPLPLTQEKAATPAVTELAAPKKEAPPRKRAVAPKPEAQPAKAPGENPAPKKKAPVKKRLPPKGGICGNGGPGRR